MAVIRRRFKPREGGGNNSRRRRCYQCQRKRFEGQKFSYRGLCEDCSAFNMIAHYFGEGQSKRIAVLDPKWGPFDVEYQPDSQTWGGIANDAS